MNKFLKIFGLVVLVLLVLLFTMPYLFKDKIFAIAKEQANANLNAKVDFKDISLSMFRSFPRLSIELQELMVSGVDSFATDTLLSIKSFYVEVDALSVMGDEIKVRAISLVSPNIYAHVLKSGKANWDITKPSADTTAVVADTATSESSFKMNLKKFEITDANIRYNDEQWPMDAIISNFDFLLSGDMTASTTDLKINATAEAVNVVMDNVRYLKQAKVTFDAGIGADLDKFIFTFKENLFNINELGVKFDGVVDMSDTSGIAMDLKFGSTKADFKSLLSLVPAIYMVDFPGLKATGEITLDGFAKGMMNNAGTEYPAFEAKMGVKQGFFQYPDLPKSVDNINVDLVAASKGGDLDNITLDINKFHMELAGNPFDMSLHVATPMSDMQVAGKFDGKLDLNSLKDVVKLDSMSVAGLIDMNVEIGGRMSSIENEKYEEFKADGKVSLTQFVFTMVDMPTVNISESTLNFTPKFVELASFNAQIGQSDMQMSGNLSNFIPYVFSDGTVSGNLIFSSKVLNINELMGGETAADTAAVADTSALTAFEVPKNIAFNLKSNIGKMIYDKLEILNTSGNVKIADGKVELQKLAMELLDGKMILDGFYNAEDLNRPGVGFGMDITGFDIAKTFAAFNTIQKMAPIAKYCNGKISAKLNITTFLDYFMNPVFESFNGDGRLLTKTVGIQDAKVFGMIADATKNETYRNPTLNDLNIGFKITDGNMEIEPFGVTMGGKKATIGGSQGIGGNLDYYVSTTVDASKAASVLNKTSLNVGNLSQVDVKVLIGGTITDPKIKGVDSQLLGDVKEAVVEEIKEKVTDTALKLIDEADKKGQQLIAEAEKQAANIREQAKNAGDKLISEADEQGKKLIQEAGSNPVKKALAKETAKKLNKEAADKAGALNREADKKATDLIDRAKAEAAKLKADAEAKVK